MMIIIDYFKNFFLLHNINYLLNAVVIFGLFLGLSLLVFQKKIKNVHEWIFWSLYSLIILIVLASTFNLFLPFSKINCLIFTAILGGVGLLLAKINHFSIKSTWYFIKEKTIIYSLGKYLLLFLALAVAFNFAIFQTSLPYTTSAGIDDFYRHNMMIKERKVQYIGAVISENWQLAFQNKNFMLLISSLYPLGVHTAASYLDIILPGSFTTPSEYFGIFMAMFMVSVIAYAKNKKQSLSFVLPLLLSPGLLYLFASDHYPAGLATIPMFLLSIIVFETAQTKAKLPIYRILLLILSFYLIYFFSLVLILPWFVFLLCIYGSLKLNKKLRRIVWISFAIVFSVGMFLLIFFRNIFLGALHWEQETTLVNPEIIFGIRNHYYDPQITTPLFFSLFIVVFLILLGLNIVTFLKTKDQTTKVSLAILGSGWLWLLVILPLFAGQGYFTIRYVAMSAIIILGYTLISRHYLINKRWYKLTLLASSAAMMFFYVGLNLKFITVRTNLLSSGVTISQFDAVKIAEHYLPINSRVMLIGENFQLPSTIQLLLYGQYDFINRPLDKADWSNDLAVLDLTNVDYLITTTKFAHVYPSFMLEKVYENFDKKVVIFKVVNHNFTPVDYDVIMTEDNKSLEKSLQYPYIAVGYESNSKSCYYYGESSQFTLNDTKNIIYSLAISEEQFDTNLIISNCF